MRSKRLWWSTGILAVGLGLAVLFRRGAEPTPRTESPAVAEEPAPPAPAAPSPTAVAPPKAAAAPPRPASKAPPAPRRLTEDELMERLHEIGGTDPVQSLELAQDGNRRYPDSPTAPERASMIVKSLSALGRHDEAREEALRMEQAYPKSDWTRDVHRHMFVNPPTHPAERGYGKKYELE